MKKKQRDMFIVCQWFLLNEIVDNGNSLSYFYVVVFVFILNQSFVGSWGMLKMNFIAPCPSNWSKNYVSMEVKNMFSSSECANFLILFYIFL